MSHPVAPPASRTSHRHVVSVSPWPVAAALARREIIRFVRQPNRVFGAVAQPLLFWLLFAVGFHRAFQVSDASFGQYFVPGTLMLIVLFTAIFATISIIEDRREGFLQGVLVAPVPRWSAVLGKVLGGTVLAAGEGFIFLVLALVWILEAAWPAGLAAAGLLLVAAFGLTSLGYVIAWRMKSTQGFHAIMNLVLMPLWLLSGAFFPLPAWDAHATLSERVLHAVMRLDPLTYIVAGLRHLLEAGVALNGTPEYWLPRPVTCWIVAVVFGLFAFAAACLVSTRRVNGDWV